LPNQATAEGNTATSAGCATFSKELFMNSGDIKQVREMIASLPDWSTMDVPDTRAFYEQLGQQFPVPDGVAVEATDAGGVKAEWVRAPAARNDAVLLYVHGGGYVIGSPASHRHQVAAISQAAGIAALSLDYRLGPEHPFPAAVDDAVSAYQSLLASDIAPHRIVVAGDSAGGGLTRTWLAASRSGCVHFALG
jgi:acetyl esterase/lipase